MECVTWSTYLELKLTCVHTPEIAHIQSVTSEHDFCLCKTPSMYLGTILAITSQWKKSQTKWGVIHFILLGNDSEWHLSHMSKIQMASNTEDAKCILFFIDAYFVLLFFSFRVVLLIFNLKILAYWLFGSRTQQMKHGSWWISLGIKELDLVPDYVQGAHIDTNSTMTLSPSPPW